MRLIFMGTPDFAVPSLDALARARHDVAAVVTRPDRPRRSRSSHLEPSPVKRAAERLRLPVLQPETIKLSGFESRLRELAPDTIVVVAFGAILPPPILDVPPRWCINLHASLLPRHRGAAPVARSIMAGERETGVTTMRMDRGLDSGEILLRRSCAIEAEETAGELTARLSVVGADLLVETLTQHERGGLKPLPQDAGAVTLAPPLGKEDGRIDWNAAGQEIAARIRACNPWPTAAASLRGEPVQLLRATAAAGGQTSRGARPPGTVVAVDGGRILVQCGDGPTLALVELRCSGRRAISARDAVNGRLIGVGDRFAPTTAG